MFFQSHLDLSISLIIFLFLLPGISSLPRSRNLPQLRPILLHRVNLPVQVIILSHSPASLPPLEADAAWHGKLVLLRHVLLLLVLNGLLSLEGGRVSAVVVHAVGLLLVDEVVEIVLHALVVELWCFLPNELSRMLFNFAT